MLRTKFRNLLHKLGHHEGSLGSKVIGSGVLVALSGVFISSIILVKTVILARLLTPEIFGLISLCMVVTRGLAIFTQTGFNSALIQREGDFHEAKDTAFTFMVIRGFLLSIIIFFIAPFVADFYDEPVLTLAIQLIGFSFIFDGFKNINLIECHKNLEFKKVVHLEQLSAILNTILVILVAYYYRSIWALVAGHIAASIISTILSYVIVPGRVRLTINKKIAWELFHYGKYITGVAAVLFIATEIDNLVVGKILGVEVLGFYYLAFMLANLPATHIAKIASKVAFPLYSKLQNDLPALNEAYLRILGMTCALAIPASFGMMALADNLIIIIFGEAWRPAILPLQLLCLLGAARTVASLNGYLLNGIGKPKVNFYIILVRTALIAISIVPLTYYFGLVGVAVSVIIPIFIQSALSLVWLQKLINLKLIKALKQISVIVLQSLVMVFVVLVSKKLLDPIGKLDLAILVLLGAGVYLFIARKHILYFIKNR